MTSVGSMEGNGDTVLNETSSKTTMADAPPSQQAPGSEFKPTQEQALQQEPAGTEPAHEPPIQLNLPLRDLFNVDRRRDFADVRDRLYEASMNGDWKAALDILNTPKEYNYPKLLQCSISDRSETMLHIAVSNQRKNFVSNLVKLMKKEDLTYQNEHGNTALFLAAITGNVDIARILLDKNEGLVKIPNKADVLPLFIATLYGKPENPKMVEFLYEKTNLNELDNKYTKWVYLQCLEAELFGTALRIFNEQEIVQELTAFLLGVLARKPSALNETKPRHKIFDSIICCFKGRPDAEISEAMQLLKNTLNFLRDQPMDKIHEILKGPLTLTDGTTTYPKHVLFVAAKMGNTKFLVEFFRQYPDLIWLKNHKDQSIFHVAVSHRYESIYNILIHETGSTKEILLVSRDKDNNSMLHLAGIRAPESRLKEVSGVAFQLQRELLWYKEVESVMPFYSRDWKNNFKQTPQQLFTNTHNKMILEGEQWMRGTASKCMLVATLVATIVFGVAFTIPGGYNQNNGFPFFLHNGPFIVFVIFDAISLISSSASILVFLSILTSHYNPEDFLESLPRKLIIGLLMLLISIMTMMTAFGISFFVLYRQKFVFVACFISVLALILIRSSIRLHYPLLINAFRSTYRSRHIFKPEQQLIYHQNPRY